MKRLSGRTALPLQGASKPTAATGVESSSAILYYFQQSTGVVGLDGCSTGCHNTRLWCTHSELGCMLNHVVDELQRLQQLLMVCGTLLVLHHQLPVQHCTLSENEKSTSLGIKLRDFVCRSNLGEATLIVSLKVRNREMDQIATTDVPLQGKG